MSFASPRSSHRPASGKLFISVGDELIAQTSDSLKYMHTADMTKGGNALFYMRKNMSTDSFEPVMAGIHLSNNTAAQEEEEDMAKSIVNIVQGETERESRRDDKGGSDSDGDGEVTNRLEEEYGAMLGLSSGLGAFGDEDPEEKKRREKERKKMEKEIQYQKEKREAEELRDKMSAVSPFGCKTDVMIRLLSNQVPKVTHYYERVFLEAVGTRCCAAIPRRIHALPSPEANRRKARSVLGWGTAWGARIE